MLFEVLFKSVFDVRSKNQLIFSSLHELRFSSYQKETFDSNNKKEDFSINYNLGTVFPGLSMLKREFILNLPLF